MMEIHSRFCSYIQTLRAEQKLLVVKVQCVCSEKHVDKEFFRPADLNVLGYTTVHRKRF